MSIPSTVIAYNPCDFTVSGTQTISPAAFTDVVVTDIVAQSTSSDGSASYSVSATQDPAAMAAIQGELALQQSSAVDPSTRVTYRPTPVTHNIKGQMTVAGDNVTVDLRVTDLAGKEISRSTRTSKFKNGKELLDAIDAAAQDIANQMSKSKASPKQRYKKIARWLKENYGDRFKEGASTDEMEKQLTQIFKEDIEPNFKSEPKYVKGFKNYIEQRQYGDLVSVE
jgi:hypothetical protein